MIANRQLIIFKFYWFNFIDDYEISGPQVQRAPEVRPRQKQPVLDSVLSKYGRPAAGIFLLNSFQNC